ncbi:type 1 glutamine amidotransferase [Carnobacterium inhibens]|uniref:type 1 glutamine amidotransferase n=1 Tax=Carnobacterium inhibens TaxID=147709 RepID=UPI000554C1C5|nr:type 1 glutamine amidotransferase [Carnobacterium inhibens]
MNIHIIQHVSFEKPGRIMDWIQENNHTVEMIKVFNREPFPKAEEVSFLIVLGGPMSANDTEHWIQNERHLIKEVVDSGKPMIGICLGAQQLAKAYGSDIISTPKEVGWHSVTSLTQIFHPSKEYTVLHWHGEGFTKPCNATLLYSTEKWENQGFRLFNAIGLQFHFEATKETVKEIIEADSQFLSQSVFSVTKGETIDFPVPDENKDILFSILNTLEREVK